MTTTKSYRETLAPTEINALLWANNVAQQLGKLTGSQWWADPVGEETGHHSWRARLRTDGEADGYTPIDLLVITTHSPTMVLVGGALPKAHRGPPFTPGAPGIGIGKARTPEQAAKAIVSRLLPGYRAWRKTVDERTARAQDYQRSVDAAASRLELASAGGLSRHNTVNSERRYSGRGGHGKDAEGWVDIESVSPDRATFKASLPIDVLERVLRAIYQPNTYFPGAPTPLDYEAPTVCERRACDAPLDDKGNCPCCDYAPGACPHA